MHWALVALAISGIAASPLQVGRCCGMAISRSGGCAGMVGAGCCQMGCCKSSGAQSSLATAPRNEDTNKATAVTDAGGLVDRLPRPSIADPSKADPRSHFLPPSTLQSRHVLIQT